MNKKVSYFFNRFTHQIEFNDPKKNQKIFQVKIRYELN